MSWNINKAENGFILIVYKDEDGSQDYDYGNSNKQFIFTTMKEVADWLINNG